MCTLRQAIAIGTAVTAIIACLPLTSGVAADRGAGAGDVVQSIPPPISQKSVPPPLQLSNEQRARIQSALASQDTEVSFGLKSAKSASNFTPAIGAKIPAGLKPQAFPMPLAGQLPQLERYTYLKFKNEILIINPMSRKVADIFPESK